MWGQCGSETGRERGGARAVGLLGRSLGHCGAGEELGLRPFDHQAEGDPGGWGWLGFFPFFFILSFFKTFYK